MNSLRDHEGPEGVALPSARAGNRAGKTPWALGGGLSPGEGVQWGILKAPSLPAAEGSGPVILSGDWLASVPAEGAREGSWRQWDPGLSLHYLDRTVTSDKAGSGAEEAAIQVLGGVRKTSPSGRTVAERGPPRRRGLTRHLLLARSPCRGAVRERGSAGLRQGCGRRGT